MADKNLRLQIQLQLAEKVLGPLKAISQGSSDTAQTLKAAREQLKQLEQTQRQMSGFQRVSAQLRSQSRELVAAQSQVHKFNSSLEEQKTRHQTISASLRTAKQSYAQITKAYQDGQLHGQEYTRQIELARISLLANEQAHGRSKAAVDKYKAQVRNATERVNKLGESVKNGQDRLTGYKQRLEAAGLSTERLAAQKRAMKGQIDTATAAIEKQTRSLKLQEEQQRQLAKFQKQAQKGAAFGAGLSAAGVASIYAGRQAVRPVQASMGAYSEQENASTQLSASMMLANGSVSKEFAQIDALAKRLGDRLPGTTADFLELMSVLKQQGLADQTILGGTGEAAALLGVQLRMAAPEAGEFAAKMQDATRTAEKDMLALMDTIQRGYYLGMDSSNMLQGFSRMSPIMGIVRKEGLEFSKTMAPLLVMMDQTGMQGGSAGNAFRKVFQSAMDTSKIQKVLRDLHKDKGIQLDFDFTDGKGEFAGLDTMYAQLEKLKSMNTETRLSFMKDIWGDDAETLQVLNAMIDRGKTGYEEIAAKMAAQASLQQRVDQQLGTFTNVVEAAQGSATNALASIGEIMAPQLKELVNWLGSAGSAANAWIKENQTLVRWLGMGVLALAAFMTMAGALLVPIGLIIAKGMAVRWMMAKVGAAFIASGGAMGLIQGGIARIAGGFGLLARWGSALFRLNPFAAVAAAVIGFALTFIENWAKIKAAFNAGDWMAIGGFIIQGLEAGLNMATLGLYALVKSALSGLITAAKAVLGIHSPSTVFAEMGAFLIDGLINGITGKLAALKNAVVGAATSAAAWFKDKLGIASPSKVFTQFGGWISEGAAQGIHAGQKAVQAAVLGVAAAATVPMQAHAQESLQAPAAQAQRTASVQQALVPKASVDLANAQQSIAVPQASVQLLNAAQQIIVPKAAVDLDNAQQSIAVPQASIQLLNAAQHIQVPQASVDLANAQQALAVPHATVELLNAAQQIRVPQAAVDLANAKQSLAVPQTSVQLINAAQQVQVPKAAVDLANAQQTLAVPQASVHLLNAAQQIHVPKAAVDLANAQQSLAVPQATVQLLNAAQQINIPQAAVDLANAQQSIAVPKASVQLLNAAQQIQVPPAIAELVQRQKPATTEPAPDEPAPAQVAQPARIAPVAPRAAAAAPVVAGPSNFNITIHAAPGQDPQAIARAVAAELDRREQKQEARNRSSMHDRS